MSLAAPNTFMRIKSLKSGCVTCILKTDSVIMHLQLLG